MEIIIHRINSLKELIKLPNSSVENFSLSITTITFELPLLKELPIPQKTKGITTIPKSIFAYIDVENFLIELNILISNILFYCYIFRYSIN